MVEAKGLVFNKFPIIYECIGIVLNRNGFSVSGVANNQRDALKLVENEAADFVLTDINLDYQGNFRIIEKIKERREKLPVIVCTSYYPSLFESICIRGGASAYTTFNDSLENITSTIKLVLDGKICYNESILRAEERDSLGMYGFHKLSLREKEVFLLLGNGNTSKEIGKKLFVATKTVDEHIYHIRTKLGIPSQEMRKQATLIAMGGNSMSLINKDILENILGSS